MDTHYSFLNKKFQAYFEDDNYILVEDDIMKAVSFNGVIYGTKAVLVDAFNIFGNRYLKNIHFKIKTGARETHEVCWQKDSAEVKKS